MSVPHAKYINSIPTSWKLQFIIILTQRPKISSKSYQFTSPKYDQSSKSGMAGPLGIIHPEAKFLSSSESVTLKKQVMCSQSTLAGQPRDNSYRYSLSREGKWKEKRSHLSQAHFSAHLGKLFGFKAQEQSSMSLCFTSCSKLHPLSHTSFPIEGCRFGAQ